MITMILIAIAAVVSLVNCGVYLEKKDYNLALAWASSCAGWSSSWILLASKM